MSQQPLQEFQSKHPVPAVVKTKLELNGIFTASEWAEKAQVDETTIRRLIRGAIGFSELQSLLKVAHITNTPVDILAVICVNSSAEQVVAYIKQRLRENKVSVRAFNRVASSRWITDPQFEQIKTYYRIYTKCLDIPLSVVASILLPEFSCRGVLTGESHDGSLNSSNFHKSSTENKLPIDLRYGK